MSIRITIIDQGNKKPLNINPNYTIKKGKELLGQIGSQWLFCGEILSDDKTFDYYGIEDGSSILVFNNSIKNSTIKIIVKTYKGKEIELNVNPNDKILEGKKLCNQTDWVWKSNGMVLNDLKTFSDYEIEDEDIIISSLKVLG